MSDVHPFREGPIEGLVILPSARHSDTRGWLAEIFRSDSLPGSFRPRMAYVSLTLPGVLRGPHEHEEQTDLFCMAGPGNFKLSFWDNRHDSPTFMNRAEVMLGEGSPGTVLVPPGVVHCYRCLGPNAGLVINCPDRLYRGEGAKGPVDEIRHEDDPRSPFVRDELSRWEHRR